jgi:hypothetical protein
MAIAQTDEPTMRAASSFLIKRRRVLNSKGLDVLNVFSFNPSGTPALGQVCQHN